MTTQREGLLDKIRALLAKTVGSGCTESEALAALDKARAMMDAHEITEDELRLTKAEAAVFRSEPRDSLDPHNIKWHLMGPVAELLQLPSLAKAETRHEGGRVLRPAIRCALGKLATRHASAVCSGRNSPAPHGNPAAQKREAARHYGVRAGVHRLASAHRLDALRDQSVAAATSNGRELVLVKNAAVDAKMKACGIKVTGCCLGGQTNDAGYQAGLSAGDRASFGRPVSGHNATLRLR